MTLLSTRTEPERVAPPAEQAPRGRKGRSRAARHRERVAWIFMAPFAVTFLCFLVFPMAYSFRMSLDSQSLIGGSHFAGLANYIEAFTDPEFLAGIGRVLAYAIVQVPIMLVLALVGALLLDAITSRFAKFFRLAAFIPYAVPGVLGALMWGYLYSPTFSPLAKAMQSMTSSDFSFLSAGSMIFSLANIAVWQWTGYNMIILYSALQGLPREMYEAAAVDGASAWTTAIRIKIPNLAPAMIMTGVFSIIGTLQLFTEPNIMRTLAPSVVTDSFTPNLYAYSLAFKHSLFNYSATVSFALAAIVSVCSYFFLFLNRRRSGLS